MVLEYVHRDKTEYTPVQQGVHRLRLQAEKLARKHGAWRALPARSRLRSPRASCLRGVVASPSSQI